MALYREGKAAMAADGTVTGTGTKWQSSLSLIRPGATIMFLSSPIQMAVVNKVVSDTEIKAITTKGAVVASSDYAILLSDSLTVDGLAQDVAETLRYYQSQETVIADAVDFFKTFDFESLQNLANQVKEDSQSAGTSAAAAAASETAAKTSETNAKASEVAAETARDQVQHIIDNAGDQSTLAVLAQSSGLKNIGQCANLTALRSLQFSSVGQQVFLKEHTSGQNAGGGIWYCHSLTSDTTYTDDNGCQIINDYGQVIRRKGVKELTSSYFGLRAGDTIDPVLLNMYKASRTFNIYEAKIENPGFDKGYVLQGGLRFYCGDKPFYILSYSVGTLRGPNLWHTGNNVGITFSRFKEDGTSQQAWSGGGINGFRFWGAASYLVEGNDGVDATPVRLSDMWDGDASNLWVTGYTGNSNGAVVSLYNEFAWTEGCTVKNVMARKSRRGITFLRNHNGIATDSFFRTVVDLSFNAGVPGQATQVMVVGDGTAAGECLVYGHDIKLTQWMSAGSWHDIVRLEDYSIIAETGGY